MVEKLKAFLKKNNWFAEHTRYLLAVSGGKDSVGMAHLFHEAGLDFAIAHVNFQLREEESNQDHSFVIELAKQLGVQLFDKKVHTIDFATEHGVSIQEAARAIRYAFFEEVSNSNPFDYVATAHHINDSLETIIYQLAKGSGFEMIKAIPLQRKHIIRPMMCFSAQEIQDYMQEKHFEWREDSSNAKSYYKRNLIRQQIIPVLKQINPSLEQSLFDTFERLRAAHQLLEESIKNEHDKVCKREGDDLEISSSLKEKPYGLMLFTELLKDYQFPYRQAKQLYESEQNGASIRNEKYKVTKEREFWLVQVNQESHAIAFEIIGKDGEIQFSSYKVRWQVMDKVNDKYKNLAENELMLDADKLSFPLTLRAWQEGDRIQPLGMKGSKLISDMMIDDKWTNSQKQNALVLVSSNELVALINKVPSEKFKIDKNTKNVFYLQINKIYPLSI